LAKCQLFKLVVVRKFTLVGQVPSVLLVVFSKFMLVGKVPIVNSVVFSKFGLIGKVLSIIWSFSASLR